MIEHIGAQLAGCGLGLHARDELAARRAQQLNLHKRKALVERVDDDLLRLGDVGRVEHQRALLLRRLDQLRRPELRTRRDARNEHRQRERERGEQFLRH